MKQSRKNELQDKIERIILQLNQAGLSYLTNNEFSECKEFLKKAERIVQNEMRINPQSIKVVKLAAVTYNNLACYYKKKNKAKISLIYLKKALELQVSRIDDIESTAGTHLNVCAIYSHLGNHEEASDHAKLAIQILQEYFKKYNQNNQPEKTFANTLMLSYYNFGIQLQYLKQFQQSITSLKKCRDLGRKSGKKNQAIVLAAEDAIRRIQQNLKAQRIKLVELVRERKGKLKYEDKYDNSKINSRLTTEDKLLLKYYINQKLDTQSHFHRFNKNQSLQKSKNIKSISKISHRKRLFTQN